MREKRTPDDYDVRTKVQDGLLQLASGKRVPAMIDCGAFGGKESARELNLPTVKSLVKGHSL